jgi:hypothetical protein
MLLHQVILVAISAVKRFESVLLSLPETVRQLVGRGKVGESDLQES